MITESKGVAALEAAVHAALDSVQPTAADLCLVAGRLVAGLLASLPPDAAEACAAHVRGAIDLALAVDADDATH